MQSLPSRIEGIYNPDFVSCITMANLMHSHRNLGLALVKRCLTFYTLFAKRQPVYNHRTDNISS